MIKLTIKGNLLEATTAAQSAGITLIGPIAHECDDAHSYVEALTRDEYRTAVEEWFRSLNHLVAYEAGALLWYRPSPTLVDRQLQMLVAGLVALLLICCPVARAQSEGSPTPSAGSNGLVILAMIVASVVVIGLLCRYHDRSVSPHYRIRKYRDPHTGHRTADGLPFGHGKAFYRADLPALPPFYDDGRAGAEGAD